MTPEVWYVVVAILGYVVGCFHGFWRGFNSGYGAGAQAAVDKVLEARRRGFLSS